MKIGWAGCLLLAAALPALLHGQDYQAADRQAVLETSLGTLILDLFPEAAPQHVRAFTQRVEEGFYRGTIFHRAIPLGIIQGGDPLTRDPSNRDLYGTGGLQELKQEFNRLSHTAGTVSAVLVPGDPDSAGSQFFICVSPQVQLDGQYTAFARVVEGLEVLEEISQRPANADQYLQERVEITRTYLRERPPPEVIPFVDTPADELARHHAVIVTDRGEIEIEFFPKEAPEHVRQFLRFSRLGLYDGTRFHRVVPSFVVQGGSMTTRKEPIPAKYRSLLTPLKPEFNRNKHQRGAVSMARSDDPNSGMDSFFIVLEDQPELDGRYTVFGRVVRGIDVLDTLSLVPLAGEAPVRAIEMEIRVIEVP